MHPMATRSRPQPHYGDRAALVAAWAWWLRRGGPDNRAVVMAPPRAGMASQGRWATHGGCCKTRPSAVFEHDPREKILTRNRLRRWHIFRGARFWKFCDSLHASPLPPIGAGRHVMMQGVRWWRGATRRIGSGRAAMASPIGAFACTVHRCSACQNAAAHHRLMRGSP